MKLNIVIPMYNIEAAIQQNVEMLKKQTHGDFRCLIVDDMSTDHTVNSAEKAISGDNRFELVVNRTRKYVLQNIYDSIGTLKPADEDVVVIVDGDDSLLHEKALETVAKAYESDNCWMTYGSYHTQKGQLGDNCKPYPQRILNNKKVRHYEFRAAHLRSFKARLWKQIREDAFFATEEEINAIRMRALLTGKVRTWYYWRNIVPADIHNTTGRFFRRCDKAWLYPLFELATHHASFIKEPIYLYKGSDIPLPFSAKKFPVRWKARCIRALITAKPSYDPL